MARIVSGLLLAPLSLLAALAGCGARSNGGGGGFTPADAAKPADTSAPGDVGTPPVDVGAALNDGGSPPLDVPTSVVDAGSPPLDVPTSVVDAGSPPLDVGTPRVDSGVTAGYVRTATTATLVEACTLPGMQRMLVSADDESATVSTPFEVSFFGIAVPPSVGLQVYSNGFISQMAADPAMTFGGTIPSATLPNGVIAPYWVDLITGADGVCAAVVGSAPSRRWIIQWKNAQFYSGVSTSPLAGSASFEVIYNESDRSMDFIYETITGQPTGAPTVPAVGLEHPNGIEAFVVCGGGRRDGVVAPECTAVTTGTRFRLAPTGG